MKGLEAILRKALSPAEIDLYSKSATYPVDKAGEWPGYRPGVSVEDGVPFNAHWALQKGVASHCGR